MSARRRAGDMMGAIDQAYAAAMAGSSFDHLASNETGLRHAWTPPRVQRYGPRLASALQWRLLTVALLLGDAIMLGAAFMMAYLTRFGSGLPVFQREAVSDATFYSTIVFSLIPLWLGVFALNGLYDAHNLLGGTREYKRVFNAASTGMMLVVLATFLIPTFVIARGWLIVSWLLAFLLVAAGRFIARRVVYAARSFGWFLAPALVVGTNDEARALAQQLVGWRSSGLLVLGMVSSEGIPKHGVSGGLPVLGHIDDLEMLIETYGITEVVVATSALTRSDLVELFRRLGPRSGVELRLSGGLFEVMTTGLSVKELAYVPLINVSPVRLKGLDVALKTLLDYGIAILGVIVLSPVFAGLALAVKLTSSGPILHRRRVLGLGGTPFDALKFRTMVTNGESVLASHPHKLAELSTSHKIKDDPRVTPVGAWMRRFSLDELPQFFNVLAGQMSVVGPRMISPAEHVEYGRWDMNLLTVKPGITGLWQVSGRSDVSYEARVQLDMHYIRNWSIWVDLQILIQTLPAVMRGRGAY